jgi:hypothetical protein
MLFSTKLQSMPAKGLTWSLVRSMAIISVSLGVLSVPTLADVPFVLRDAAGNPLPGYVVTEFATGLRAPVGMLALNDGSILYGSNIGANNGASAPMFTGTFAVNRLIDSNNNGIADNGVGATLFQAPENFGGLTSIARAGDLLVTLSSRLSANDARLTFLRIGGTQSDPTLSYVNDIHLTFAGGGYHQSYGLAVRPVGTSGNYEVYFNVGSAGDGATSLGSNLASANGMGFSGATMNRDTIYRFQLDNTGTSPMASNLAMVAYGVRNAAGMAFHPTTGELYFQDNGLDGSSGPTGLGADELNVISTARLNNLGVIGAGDYGHDNDYFVYGGPGAPEGYQAGDRWNEMGRDGILPVAVFIAQDGRDAQGVNHIAFSPSNWTGELADGLFAGFHGRFSSGGTANNENPVIFFDLNAIHTPSLLDGYWQLIHGQTAGIGHLDGLLSTADYLYLADMTITGNWIATQGRTNGVIYRIAEIAQIPEPSGLIVLLLGGVTVILRRSRGAKSEELGARN